MLDSHPKIKDNINIIFFIIAVLAGAWIINATLFRSFNVSGPSMESTLYTGDRLIVSRLQHTLDTLGGTTYTPERGHVIVFKNPMFINGTMRSDEYIVKRVIGFPGERVVVADGAVTVYNTEHPNGFNPYDGVSVYESNVSGSADVVVPEGEIFVIGDHRAGNYSLDSRNGLGTIPMNDIVGPVVARIFPFTKISFDF